MSRDQFVSALALVLIAILGAALSASVFTAPADARRADEPAYRVVAEDGAIQIRDYAPMILASTRVEGGMGRAGNAGFRPLAGYIFGDNRRRDGAGNAEIAMTTPVMQAQTPSQSSQSQEIAMTTPVTQRPDASGGWQVSFIMPPEWEMDTLPVPNNARVELHEMPARRLATLRFNGGPRESRFQAKAEELRAWLEAAGYTIEGEVIYARYDPPWVPTPLRRNEVMFEITGGPVG